MARMARKQSVSNYFVKLVACIYMYISPHFMPGLLATTVYIPTQVLFPYSLQL